jgi:RNA polymerase primary sigma factor
VVELAAVDHADGAMLHAERSLAFVGHDRDGATAFRTRDLERQAAKAARATADPTVAEAPEVESKDELPVAEDAGELDLTPGMLEKTNDPVRMYLREMGTVPLLTREGEVAIAKRIERGQLLVLKTITRSPIILKELLTIGDDLRKGTRSIKEIVQFDDEELTEEKIENKTKKTLKVLDKIADAVLAYRPKPKSKPAKKRQRRRRKAQRDSCI